MNKLKPNTTALQVWKTSFQGPYVLSCKLDGVSALYSTESGIPQLYTRGNGKIGQNISHFLPYLHLPKMENITIRGEFIILKKDFEEHLKNTFANPRNLVAGIINQKQIDKNIQYVHFIAYEVIEPQLTPSEQMRFLEKASIPTVLYKKVEEINNEILSELLVKWRKEYEYEMDGIIVAQDNIYSRKSGNPEHAFAFKMVLSEQIAESKVVDVIWTPSKDGYLKPRVQIEPIHLGGVTIEYATGFNASFIEQHKIGIGALIEIIRSGDVIPYIKSVTMPAESAKMPSVPYTWNDTHVDVLLQDVSCDATVKEKIITGFFKGIGVEGLSVGNIHRFVEAGYDSIPIICKMTINDILKIDGFKEKLSNKIYTEIQEKVKNASLIDLMTYSNLFGRGISGKKMEAIMQELPNILVSSETKIEKRANVEKIKGMAAKSADLFVDGISPFLHFLQELNLQHKLSNSEPDANKTQKECTENVNHPLYKKNIVLTGFRNKEIMDLIACKGGNVANSVTKNTFVVIAKTKTEDTGKALDAHKLNIPILTPIEFLETYS